MDRAAILQELSGRKDSLTPQQQAVLGELQRRLPGQAEPQAATANPMVNASGEEATVPARSGGPIDVVKPAILPTLGQIGGGIVGARFGGPRGAMVGESIGGGLGGVANQALGITEPSIKEPLIDAAVPPAVRGVVGLARIGKQMYGQTGAANINRVLPEEAANRVNTYMPNTPASNLFQQAEREGTLIPMAPATQPLSDTLTFINGLSSGTKRQYREALTIAKGLDDKITAQGGHLTPIDLQNELAGLNRSITKLQRTGAPGVDKLVAVKEGLLDSLDQAAIGAEPQLPSGHIRLYRGESPSNTKGGDWFTTNKAKAQKYGDLTYVDVPYDKQNMAKFAGGHGGPDEYITMDAGIKAQVKPLPTPSPGAQTLQSARHTYMRQESVKELGDYIEKAITLKKGVGGDTQFSPNQVLNKIKKDRFFTKSFSEGEQAEILGMLEMMNKAPAIGPGAGVNFGSGAVLKGLMPAIGLGGVGHYATGNPEIAAGMTAVGAAMPAMSDVAHNFALAMQTNTGRKFLKGLLTNSNGAVTPQVITSLSEAMGGMTAKTPQPQSVSEARTRVQPMDVMP